MLASARGSADLPAHLRLSEAKTTHCHQTDLVQKCIKVRFRAHILSLNRWRRSPAHSVPALSPNPHDPADARKTMDLLKSMFKFQRRSDITLSANRTPQDSEDLQMNSGSPLPREPNRRVLRVGPSRCFFLLLGALRSGNVERPWLMQVPKLKPRRCS